MKKELVFYERQRFNKWLAIVFFLFINSLYAYLCFGHLVIGEPLDNDPVSNIILTITAIFMFLFTVVLFFIRIDTVINEEGVWVRVFPFYIRFKLTPWDYISEFAVKKMNLIGRKWFINNQLVIRRVRGKGIRLVGRKSYILSGNHVLELTIKNDKKIFIGTQQPEALTEFLDKLDARRKQK